MKDDTNNEFEKKVSCPYCDRTIGYYLSGNDMKIKFKCIRNSCKQIFILSSAGNTFKISDII